MAREIIIESYNEEWVEQYKQAERLLTSIFKNQVVDIQHIGSTAIAGLSAKPTIDILVVVKNINDIDLLNDTMKNYGFIANGENGIEGRRYFYKTLPQNSYVQTHHIHVYQTGNPKYKEELLFRDYLRIDNVAMREYEALKVTLANRFRHDPIAYTNAKTEFITNTMQKARTYFDVCK